MLLTKDGFERIRNSSNLNLVPTFASDSKDKSHRYPVTYQSQSVLATLSYAKLRDLAVFNPLKKDYDLKTGEELLGLTDLPAVKVPKLSDYCIRAIGKACLVIADQSALNGGIRPKIPWMQAFNLQQLPSVARAKVSHYLDRCNRLHTPGVYRLFWPSVVDARSIRVDSNTREYLGHTRTNQGQYKEDYSFLQFTDPRFGHSDTLARQNDSPLESIGFAKEEADLRATISVINRLRPKFVVVTGDFTEASPSEPGYDSQVDGFRK